jgi:hypothetical protein
MAVTWSPTNKNANVTLSGGNLVATGSNTLGTSASGIATLAVTTGQLKYFEFTATHIDNSNSVMVGVGNASTAITDGSYLGIDTNSFGFIADGRVVFNNSVPTTLAGYASGNIIGVAVRKNDGTIFRRINGGNWNDNPSADPVTNTGGLTIGVTGDLFPAYCTHGGGGDQSVTTGNFGATSFANSPPTGFTGLDSASGISLSLAATEATDTASFSASLKDTLSLGATEASDTASFAASLKDISSLATTEGADTASFTASLKDALSLATTEVADAASFAAALSDLATLSANESPDTASFTLVGQIDLSLAATEALDTASFAVSGSATPVDHFWPFTTPRKRKREDWLEKLIAEIEAVPPTTPPRELVRAVERRQAVKDLQREHTAREIRERIFRLLREQQQQDDEEAFLLLAA